MTSKLVGNFFKFQRNNTKYKGERIYANLSFYFIFKLSSRLIVYSQTSIKDYSHPEIGGILLIFTTFYLLLNKILSNKGAYQFLRHRNRNSYQSVCCKWPFRLRVLTPACVTFSDKNCYYRTVEAVPPL